ncbi:MmcQ/YjbR family DNA-binding protein [uncultured Alistipes sp.]|uniref:MmcQ/YjbR family DNA-binding protein n=1 Tax=uncultured Alistipes sp. TaxID=538949 RepID=UPI0026134883|nr:MmcQ/YjbR family DNA-binding protein [uncultured Alistipes sp.]
MDLTAFRDYCLSLPFTEETTPFDETTLVYKVGGRMYAFADMVEFRRVALKCDPDEAILLRERYPDEVTPAYHTNKRLWNDIRTTGDLPERFIREQIRNSYLLVIRQNVTPRTRREEILRYVEEHGLPE